MLTRTYNGFPLFDSGAPPLQPPRPPRVHENGTLQPRQAAVLADGIVRAGLTHHAALPPDDYRAFARHLTALEVAHVAVAVTGKDSGTTHFLVWLNAPVPMLFTTETLTSAEAGRQLRTWLLYRKPTEVILCPLTRATVRGGRAGAVVAAP